MVGVLELVDQHVARGLLNRVAAVRMGPQQVEHPDDREPEVLPAVLGQPSVVGLVDARELELAARAVGGGARAGARDRRLGPPAVGLGGDQLVAAGVDAPHEVVHHPDPVAAQVVHPQVELAQPVEHHQHPVLGAGDRGVGEQPALAAVHAGDVQRVGVEGRDPERLVRGAEDLLGARAQLDGRLAREREGEDLVR